jgi:carbamoyltransferase
LRKFQRLLATYLATAPASFESFPLAIRSWLTGKAFQKRALIARLRLIDSRFNPATLLFSTHHGSHAASAFYASPFSEAAVLTIDGVGEWTTTSAATGVQSDLQMLWELRFPHSLGLLYSAFTQYLGFKVNSGEQKVMGLAPYGRPRFANLILDHLMDLKADGTFRLDCRYLGYCGGLRMINDQFERLLGAPARVPESDLEQRHFDIAASIQAVTDETVLRISRSLASSTGMKNLCMAGGVALNCVSNGKVLRDGRFSRVWVQPAAGDAGGALGAALAVHYQHFHQTRGAPQIDLMSGSYLGPAYSDGEIEDRLGALGACFVRLPESEFIERSAHALAEGQAIGWFQGRMEFGPRALGARSILADARDPGMQRTLNLKVKRRESFRPFAPAVLREDAEDWFDLREESPYMLVAAPIAASKRIAEDGQEVREGLDRLQSWRSQIPAATHVDYSARVQTVDGITNPRFAELLRAFKRRTGCPILLNTSFNIRGEPIVCTPEDAYRCFMGTSLDALAIGNFFLQKQDQRAGAPLDYASAVALD